MVLKGKLKREFEEWVLEYKTPILVTTFEDYSLRVVVYQLPLSMQFALLCDFLEDNRCIIALNKAAMCYEVEIMIGYRSTYFLDRSTKIEAIEKAIEYLNDNY